MLDKHPRIQTILAILLAIPAAWAISILFLLGLAFYTGTAHAQKPAASTASSAGTQIHCTPHKTILGFTWGWDCGAEGGPAVTTIKLYSPDPSHFWCDGPGHECKGTGEAQMQVNGDGLAAFGKAQRLRLALDCTLAPGSAIASCKVATDAIGGQK